MSPASPLLVGLGGLVLGASGLFLVWRRRTERDPTRRDAWTLVGEVSVGWIVGGSVLLVATFLQ